jgi:hypothetical protein
MPVVASIEFPRADVDALFRQMDRQSRLLGKSLVHSLNAAAMYLGRSLGASTKMAPKTRPVKALPLKIAKGQKSNINGQPVIPWGVTGWFGRPRTYQTRILRTSKGKAYVKERLGMIRRRGLAKKTMASMAKNVGGIGAAGMAHMSYVAQDLARIASKHGKNTRGGGEHDPWILMENTLNYATDALKGGEMDISTAMGRAARGMEKSINAQLRRRFGLD